MVEADIEQLAVAAVDNDVLAAGMGNELAVETESDDDIVLVVGNEPVLDIGLDARIASMPE